jgi:hypothetical protein
MDKIRRIDDLEGKPNLKQDGGNLEMHIRNEIEHAMAPFEKEDCFPSGESRGQIKRYTPEAVLKAQGRIMRIIGEYYALTGVVEVLPETREVRVDDKAREGNMSKYLGHVGVYNLDEVLCLWDPPEHATRLENHAVGRIMNCMGEYFHEVDLAWRRLASIDQDGVEHSGAYEAHKAFEASQVK